MTMLVTSAGSMPAACQRLFLVMLPAVGASWAPVPESISTSPPLVRHGRDGEGDRHVRIRQAAGLERGLGLVEGGVADELLVVRLLPDAVVHLDDLDVADLEFDDLGPGRLLADRLADELERPVQAEGGSGRCRGNHEPTA